MLIKLPVFLSLVFAIIYPLGFWLHYPDPIVTGFRRFNLGLANFVGGLAIFGLVFQGIPQSLKLLAVIWLTLSLLVTFFLWNKKNVSPHLVTIPVIIGIILLGKLHPVFLDVPANRIWSTLIGGGVLCSVVFTTVLGHWYLNVPGLSLSHLIRATNVFWFFVALRAAIDLFLLFFGKVMHGGDMISILTFMQRMDGFLLWVALAFGTLLPLICNYFVIGTLKVKSTQSATGILYAILVAVFMGELCYKFYLIKFGLAL